VVRRRASAVFAALICWMLLTVATSAAYASCGDWLQHGDNSSASLAPSRLTAVARDAFAEPPQGPLCNGLYCTRVPEQPVAPTPAEVLSAPAKSALQIGLLTLAECSRQSQIASECSAKRAKGFPALIYHPPRA
jgi:hypothetical protein